GGGAAPAAISVSADGEEIAKPENRVLDFGFEEQEETVPKLKALRSQTKTATKASASSAGTATKKKDDVETGLQIEAAKPRSVTTGTSNTPAASSAKTGTRRVRQKT